MQDIKDLFAPLLICIENEYDYCEVWDTCRQARLNGMFAIDIIEMLNLHRQDMFITDNQITIIDKLISDLSGNAEKSFDLSDTQEQVQAHIEFLVEKYKYHKLPKTLSERSRKLYLSTLPLWCNIDGDKTTITTSNGMIITNGYERIVIGDFGAYIEFDRKQAVRENICGKKGQEYRYRDPNFINQVKYFWYTTKDNSDPKIYFQQKKVTYADYKIGKLYISPFECYPLNNSE
ncbi:hypothetical protein [Photobacterium damselae]|uniref:hypothetical protein n=1 Tax=Photobacterium damselae TaxID=38293 RepID=UPI001F1C6461|nr:hypothetical protein [Photobacterium damselae]UKA04996.1 hypothetical protein IHC89_22380 [Photobacterium damselae subsp. damselae]